MLDFSMYILLLVVRVVPIPVDNGVDGDPEIECGPTTIAVNLNTRKPFEGHVYVKPRFLTKVDRAYRISCFYMEASKDVGSQIDVSELTTESVTRLVQMPICRYDILEGGPNGIPVEFGRIGQQVYHRWSCTSEFVNTFCMLVHSCTVDDGKGDRVNILDSNGCALDRYILNNLEYPEDLLAGQEAHVYKYADRDSLFFQCQISIQVKEKGECVRPICPDLSNSSPVKVFNKNRQAQDLSALKVRDSVVTRNTPLPFSLPVTGYLQEFPRRHPVHTNGASERPFLENQLADSRIVRVLRSASSKHDESFTVDVRAELTALDIVDEKSTLEFRDVCMSGKIFFSSVFSIFVVFLSVTVLTVLHIFRSHRAIKK